MRRIKAAVVGLGYWGPNLLRNLQISADFDVVAGCDANPERLARAATHHPGLACYSSIEALLGETKPELLVIATPVASHYSLVLTALRAGCHVLCENPLAATVREARDLVEAAKQAERFVFVDNTFEYTAAVRSIREHYRQGALGSLLYIDSVRINLGVFQSDVDVVWDLAPHDLSILQYVVGEKVTAVQANGTAHNPRKLVDVAYLTLRYDSGLTAHLHLSWLSPVKVRRMIFSGTKSSLIFDDLEMAEKLKIYDHGVSFDTADVVTRSQVLVNYRRGEMRAPALDNREALATEFAEIAACLRGQPSSAASAADGLQVVRVLEAAERSIVTHGSWIAL
jgi:predicted dehydrogenase